jgi:hypothetical protein
MAVFLKAAGVGGSLLVLIALAIAFFKSILAFIAFLTGAIKILIVLIFVALIIGIGFMVIKGWNEAKRAKS